MHDADELMRALAGASAEDRAAWRRLLARVGPQTISAWLVRDAVELVLRSS